MLVPTEGEMTASLHGDREPYRPAALRADDQAELSEALARCRSCLAAALGELGSSEGVESLPELRAEGLLRTVQAELEVAAAICDAAVDGQPPPLAVHHHGAPAGGRAV